MNHLAHSFDYEVESLLRSLCLEIAQATGVQLGEKQRSMVISRLQKRALDLGLNGIQEYLQYYQSNTVTEKSYAHLWLSEGFAVFFTNFYLEKKYGKDTLKKRFCGQKTKIFFLYGAKEVEDIYGLETWKHYTAVFFRDCSNVKVRYTNEKHVWSSGDISKILSGK